MKRRGAKRKLANREPNGRAQRSRPEMRENMRSVALEARERVFGVSKQTAEDMPESAFLGRLRADNIAFERAAKSGGTRRGDVPPGITARQYDAATDYQELIRNWDRVHLLKGYPEAANMDRGGGYDSSDGTDPFYLDWVRRICDTKQNCDDVLRDAAKVDWRVPIVIEAVVMHGNRAPDMLGTLRIGLNALANALNIPAEGTVTVSAALAPNAS